MAMGVLGSIKLSKARIGWALVFVALLLAFGCVAVNAVKLGPGETVRPKVAAKDVTVYLTASDVKGDYEQIALLNATGSSGWTTEAKMVARLREKAGELGANGLILDAMSEPSAGAKVAGAIFGVGTERKGKAIAIFVTPKKDRGFDRVTIGPTKEDAYQRRPTVAPWAWSGPQGNRCHSRQPAPLIEASVS